MSTKPRAAGERAGPDFQNPKPALASSNASQILKFAAADLTFQREDWTSFRTIEGLRQKAGVAEAKLRRLVLKELTDNALDAGAEVQIGRVAEGRLLRRGRRSGHRRRCRKRSLACSASPGR